MTLVAEAQTRQSPTQNFTKKFEKIFVPCVIALAFVTSFSFLILDETAAQSFYRAMAVLVAASPCALAIATPSAVLSGVARAARGGVLIKGGAPLEAMGHLDAIAFDKTGTLTKGTPELTDLVMMNDLPEDELLPLIGAVEARSEHPIAQAILRRAEAAGPIPGEVSDFQSHTGFGVSATVMGRRVTLGADRLMTRDGIDLGDTGKIAAELAKAGKTPLYAALDGQLAAVIAVDC